MKFVLIMSTLGRTAEVEIFFDHLARQTVKNVSVYLCDQNDDDRLSDVLARANRALAIRIVKSPRGLSRGRNAALAHALDDLRAETRREDVCVVFPDDDCWYADPNLLATIAGHLENEPTLNGLTIRSVDAEGIPSARTSPNVRTDLTAKNIFVGSMAISYSIFLRLPFVDAVGNFDETLGVGAGTRWGAGEESDYLIRGIKRGQRLRYYPELEVRHPRRDILDDGQRILGYACGHGRVLRKNGYSFLFLGKEIVVALAAFGVYTLTRRRIMTPYLVRARGYFSGFFSKAA